MDGSDDSINKGGASSFLSKWVKNSTSSLDKQYNMCCFLAGPDGDYVDPDHYMYHQVGRMQLSALFNSRQFMMHLLLFSHL